MIFNEHYATVGKKWEKIGNKRIIEFFQKNIYL